MGHDLVERDEVEEPGQVRRDPGHCGRAHRRVPEPDQHARLRAGLASARRELCEAARQSRGEAERRGARDELDDALHRGAAVFDVGAVEGHHHDDADRHAESEAGEDVRDQHPARVRRAQQRIRRGEARGTQRAREGQDDDLETSRHGRRPTVRRPERRPAGPRRTRGRRPPPETMRPACGTRPSRGSSRYSVTRTGGLRSPGRTGEWAGAGARAPRPSSARSSRPPRRSPRRARPASATSHARRVARVRRLAQAAARLGRECPGRREVAEGEGRARKHDARLDLVPGHEVDEQAPAAAGPSAGRRGPAPPVLGAPSRARIRRRPARRLGSARGPSPSPATAHGRRAPPPRPSVRRPR